MAIRHIVFLHILLSLVSIFSVSLLQLEQEISDFQNEDDVMHVSGRVPVNCIEVTKFDLLVGTRNVLMRMLSRQLRNCELFGQFLRHPRVW